VSEPTPAVRLRPVVEPDLPIFYEHQRDPEAWRMAARAPREREVFLRHWREVVLGGSENRARTIEVDGAPVGYVCSFDLDGRRMVGYWLGRASWGRGIASAALRAYLGHEAARPLHAWVAVDNRGSVRVLEKAGFVPVGGHEVGQDGVAEQLFRLER
jgi:RimJ/RimL family protein N-acetyltransferase